LFNLSLKELAATEYGEPASSAAETSKSIPIASSTQSSSSPSPSPPSTPSQANYEGNANFQEVGDNDQQQRGESPIQPSAIPNNLHDNSVKVIDWIGLTGKMEEVKIGLHNRGREEDWLIHL
jgi:hypothetical protein